MKNKAKRIIKEFDFESEGASVHLVHKKQGGPANKFKTCIMKSESTKELPDVEDIDIQKKLEQIKVTMSMEEFLRKFFDMYYYDAELLTAMLGFKTESEEMSDNLDKPEDYQSYLKDKVSSFEVMKSMHDNTHEELLASDIVNILEYQDKIEKQLIEALMDKITIEKSRFSALEQAEKDLNEKIDLIKSLEGKLDEQEKELSVIKKAQEDAALEAMKTGLKGLVGEDKIEKMAKSLLIMEEEVRSEFLETLKLKKSALDNSDLMEEVGHDEETSNQELSKNEEFEKKLAKALAV